MVKQAKCEDEPITLRMEIRERQQVTEQLRESEERFRMLANQAPIMIWEANAQGAITFLNATWCTFTSLSAHDGLDADWIEAVHPDDRPGFLEHWKQTLVTPGQPFHTEFRLQRADGVYREVVAHGSVYQNQQGAFLGYTGTFAQA
jgi:PAS domain S-box-containing protein